MENRALVVVAGYMGSVPLMMAFTALAALGQGPWQGDMNRRQDLRKRSGGQGRQRE